MFKSEGLNYECRKSFSRRSEIFLREEGSAFCLLPDGVCGFITQTLKMEVTCSPKMLNFSRPLRWSYVPEP